MRFPSIYWSIQKMSTQSTMDAGAANKKPRAKLPFRIARPRNLPQFSNAEDSFTLIVLSIMVSNLLLLAEKGHRAISGFQSWTNSRKTASQYYSVSPLGSWRRRALKWSRPLFTLAREIMDLAFVIRLVVAPRRKNTESVYQAIMVRSERRRRRRHKGWALRLAAFVCVSLLAPRMALAETTEVITPVELFDPDSGDGVRVSPGFILFPRATTDLTYDSNIYNVETPETEDAVVSFRPTLALRSDFARHSVSLEGTADIRRYFDISDENSEQYSLTAATLLDLADGIDVDATVGFARGIERRGTVGDVFLTDEPVAFHDKRAALEISRTGRTLELSVGAGILKRDYSDTQVGGVDVDLSFRDVEVRTARVRADLGLNDKTKIFAELSGNEIDYELARTPSLDSRGFAALVGVSHELTALIEVEAGVGYIKQDFKDPALSSASEFNYRLAASWTPEPEWRLTASATRLVDPSRNQESPAIISSEFRLGAQRAIGDRVLVGAAASYVEENFRASPRKDKRFTVSGSVTYRLADNIGLIATAGYRDQDGGTFGRTYDGASASIGVRVAW